ncbi:hypothetical protein BH11MYX1_BH11MYX1_28570 [soil metagenome]
MVKQLASFLLLAGCVTAGSEAPDAGGGGSDGASPAMRLIQANVGNVALTCHPYKFKLCYAATEGRLAASLASHDADVISLQELVTPEQCAAMLETEAARVCFAAHTAKISEQARRLVGEGYTIACDTRSHYECVAVKRTWGAIAGCPDGELCIDAAVTETADAVPGCDAGFSASAVVIQPRKGTAFRLVDAHPPSGAAVACRHDTLVKVFEGDAALARGNRSLLSGDFNLDPFAGNDASEQYFRTWVGAGKAFHYHSGPAEHSPPHITASYPQGFGYGGDHTYDHVFSNFASGTCTTLGEAPSTLRLDGGSGTDHRALLCNLSI